MRGGERPGDGDKVVGMRYMYAYIEPCACVCVRDMQIFILVGFSKSDCMPRPFAELVTCIHIPSVAFQPLGVLRSMQL